MKLIDQNMGSTNWYSGPTNIFVRWGMAWLHRPFCHLWITLIWCRIHNNAFHCHTFAELCGSTWCRNSYAKCEDHVERAKKETTMSVFLVQGPVPSLFIGIHEHNKFRAQDIFLILLQANYSEKQWLQKLRFSFGDLCLKRLARK